jgi:hypothetical protein
MGVYSELVQPDLDEDEVCIHAYTEFINSQSV